MSVAVRIGAALLGVAIFGGGTAAFMAQASSHPRVEPSVAANCAGCHMTDYRKAAHHVGERPTTCGTCHTQNAWHDKTFDHPFNLSGKHLETSCFKCHTGEPAVFHGTPSNCVDCHRKEYDGAEHHVGHFPVTCHDCHGFKAWKPILEDAVFPPDPQEPPPPPPPTTTATATTPTATVTHTVKPPPTHTVKPPPTHTVKPPPTVPDVVTHPSGHEHAE